MEGRKDRDYSRFGGLTFEDTMRLAVDPSLSKRHLRDVEMRPGRMRVREPARNMENC